jgi:hypothetical protein
LDPSSTDNGILAPVRLRRLVTTIRYYWITAKGYRLRPWASPYIRWRMETFYGTEAASLDVAKFLKILWRDRMRMRRFITWVGERRRAQRRSGV